VADGRTALWRLPIRTPQKKGRLDQAEVGGIARDESAALLTSALVLAMFGVLSGIEATVG